MNIFVTDPSPTKSALYLDVKRRNKMILETVQILCTALHKHGHSEDWMYRKTHENHPACIFASKSRANFRWLLAHLRALSEDYTNRTGKTHKSSLLGLKLANMTHLLPDIPRTPFVNCAANESKGISFKQISCVFIAYKLYLDTRWATDKIKPKW